MTAPLVVPTLTVLQVLLNLEAVRTGAVCASDDAIRPLLRAKLVRNNAAGWLDLTRRGRAVLLDGGAALVAAYTAADAATATDAPDIAALEQRARELGAAAFHRGARCVPALDPDFLPLLPSGCSVGTSLPILSAWHRGWTEANLAAPLPGVC